MITLRPHDARGHAHHGWLESWHSFSFADYHDPAHMGFGNLRVINEDFIAPGTGFGTHGHRDMEIVTYVLQGALQHRDSLGQSAVIRPGELQRMSAGTGVRHSEHAADPAQPTHLLQIWLLPSRAGLTPSYEQREFPAAARRGRLQCVAAPGGPGGALSLNADAAIHAGLFDGDESAELALPAGRCTWVQLARGTLRVNGQPLVAGDALGLVDEPTLRLEGGQDAEVLVFDLAR